MADESPVTLEDKKRKRCPNFIATEKSTLISIIDEYKHIIECKKTDSVSNKTKQEAWRKISNKFNSQGISPEYRSAEKLKFLWDNLKRSTRRNMSDLRKEMFKTGGGTCVTKEDPLCLQVKCIIGKAIEPMTNDYDDDVPEDRALQEAGLEFATSMDIETGEMDKNKDISINLPDNEVTSDDDTVLEQHDWASWNPVSLRTEKHPLLEIKTITPTVHVSTPTTTQMNNDNEKEHLKNMVINRLSKKRNNKASIKTKLEPSPLVQAKIDYIKALKKIALEKFELEKLVLQNTLCEQKLKIELLNKELGRNVQ